MSDVAISVENLGKAYRIGLKEEIPDSLMGAAVGWVKAPLRNLHRLRRLNTFNVATDSDAESDDDTIWALKDVSFEVKRGEVVGIIGRNGAGKSTLLKVLSRITEPTTGRAVIHGRVSALLEVGTGFHPEMSGRENVYMNGTILGMTKREIDRKFDEIVDFSGVEKFLDTPVKRYSSGMKVRLAFAVAAHLEPEILIIDEVLAVGDAEFQAKCLGKMQDVAQTGRTVLFVSHNMAAVKGLCGEALVISKGKLALREEVGRAVDFYLKESLASNVPCHAFDSSSEAGDFQFTRCEVLNELGNHTSTVMSGETVTFLVGYRTRRRFAAREIVIALSIWDAVGNRVGLFSTDEIRPSVGDFHPEGMLHVKIPRFPLRGGAYVLKLFASQHGTSPDGILCVVERASKFTVLRGDYWGNGSVNRAGAFCLIDATIANFSSKAFIAEPRQK